MPNNYRLFITMLPLNLSQVTQIVKAVEMTTLKMTYLLEIQCEGF